jgi:hypothetical protein
LSRRCGTWVLPVRLAAGQRVDLNGDDSIDGIDFGPLATGLAVFGRAASINEVLAVNAAFMKDQEGEYDDWIEIHNAGQQPIDCAGMYLTDDAANPRKWQFPTGDPTLTTIPAMAFS